MVFAIFIFTKKCGMSSSKKLNISNDYCLDNINAKAPFLTCVMTTGNIEEVVASRQGAKLYILHTLACVSRPYLRMKQINSKSKLEQNTLEVLKVSQMCLLVRISRIMHI